MFGGINFGDVVKIRQFAKIKFHAKVSAIQYVALFPLALICSFSELKLRASSKAMP